MPPFNGWIIVAPAPDTGSVVRRKAYKPDVDVAGGRTALSGAAHIGIAAVVPVDLTPGTGTRIHCIALHNILHRAG